MSNLPNEIVNNILGKMPLTPSFVYNFNKRLTKETIKKVLNCKEILKLQHLNEQQKLKEIKQLKKFNKVCNKKDLILASKKNYQRIFEYIVQQLNIEHSNIFRLLLDVRDPSSSEYLYKSILIYFKRIHVVIKRTKLLKTAERIYVKLILTLSFGNTNIIKLFVKYKPFNHKIEFKTIYHAYLSLKHKINPPANLYDDYKNLLRIGKESIIFSRKYIPEYSSPTYNPSSIPKYSSPTYNPSSIPRKTSSSV